MSVREVMSASFILGRPRRLLFLCVPFVSASLPPPPFAIMQSFIGRVPVSVRFDTGVPRCLVPKAIGLILGHCRVGQHFVEVLMAEYEGRPLTTDVECEVVCLPDDTVVLGSNWMFVWLEVWRSQLGSPSIPECHSVSPASGCSRDLILSTISLYIMLELPAARVQLCPTLYHLQLIRTVLCTEVLFFYTVSKCCRHMMRHALYLSSFSPFLSLSHCPLWRLARLIMVSSEFKMALITISTTKAFGDTRVSFLSLKEGTFLWTFLLLKAVPRLRSKAFICWMLGQSLVVRETKTAE